MKRQGVLKSHHCGCQSEYCKKINMLSVQQFPQVPTPYPEIWHLISWSQPRSQPVPTNRYSVISKMVSCSTFISHRSFRFDQMGQWEPLIWSNGPMGTSHLFKTNRTMTDERAIAYLFIKSIGYENLNPLMVRYLLDMTGHWKKPWWFSKLQKGTTEFDKE